MNLAALLYVDHQEVIQYPLDYVIEKLDFVQEIFVFGSDANNRQLAEKQLENHPLKERIRFGEVGIHINKPEDISAAQNACFENAKTLSSADYFVFVQADILVLPQGRENILRFCEATTADFCEETKVQGDFVGTKRAAIFDIQHVRLHQIAHVTNFGLTVLGKDTVSRFVGDGAYPKHYHNGTPDCGGHTISALDIGYFSVDVYGKHVEQHRKTWRTNNSFHQLYNYKAQRTNFIKGATLYMRHKEYNGPHGMMPLDGPYGEVVERFGLRAEYDEVAKIVATL